MANKHHDMVRDDPTLMSIREPEGDADDDSESMADKPPIHPVPCMQGAFEESMIETTNDASGQSSKVQSEKIDSATRRRILLEQEANEETHAAKWRQKPGERYHPLWKLVAQIAFGVHLLHKQMAKSDEEVIKILQTHVDEVDGFLERTTEDFDLAINDIEERMRYLKLPLEHSEVFDEMLTVREFRIEIVDGNEKIEHIINRTAAAMTDALRDIKQGLDATKELARYQIRLDKEWEYRSPELESVYLAMKGNAEGWFRCFVGLQTKGDVLGVALQQLGSVVAEIQKRAGVASRKAIVSGSRLALSTLILGGPAPGAHPIVPIKALEKDLSLTCRVAFHTATHPTSNRRREAETRSNTQNLCSASRITDEKASYRPCNGASSNTERRARTTAHIQYRRAEDTASETRDKILGHIT